MTDLKAQLIERVMEEVKKEFSSYDENNIKTVTGARRVLDIVLKDAVQVYGNQFNGGVWYQHTGKKDERTALLINIQPLEQPVTLKEVTELLKGAVFGGTGCFTPLVNSWSKEAFNLLKRVEKYGVTDGDLP